MRRYYFVVAGVVLLLGAGFWFATDSGNETVATQGDRQPSGSAMANVVLPDELSANAQIGKRAFELKCAVCHGANAAGQNGVAPPLVHSTYRPAHHGDGAFLAAARNGVRSHHWRFGNMPPIEGLTDGDVKMIVAYVRELQRANGIN